MRCKPTEKAHDAIPLDLEGEPQNQGIPTVDGFDYARFFIDPQNNS
jgi:hypothetical protein